MSPAEEGIAAARRDARREARRRKVPGFTPEAEATVNHADVVRKALRLYAEEVERAIRLSASLGSTTEELLAKHAAALDLAANVESWTGPEGLTIRIQVQS